MIPPGGIVGDHAFRCSLVLQVLLDQRTNMSADLDAVTNAFANQW